MTPPQHNTVINSQIFSTNSKLICQFLSIKRRKIEEEQGVVAKQHRTGDGQKLYETQNGLSRVIILP